MADQNFETLHDMPEAELKTLEPESLREIIGHCELQILLTQEFFDYNEKYVKGSQGTLSAVRYRTEDIEANVEKYLKFKKLCEIFRAEYESRPPIAEQIALEAERQKKADGRRRVLDKSKKILTLFAKALAPIFLACAFFMLNESKSGIPYYVFMHEYATAQMVLFMSYMTAVPILATYFLPGRLVVVRGIALFAGLTMYAIILTSPLFPFGEAAQAEINAYIIFLAGLFAALAAAFFFPVKQNDKKKNSPQMPHLRHP
ncbi:MAG: hypothetical protein FWE82_04755, partial [Defluviitaleaceae bacterium]|nr:hypothetical protein [Defluviitaleaceae bacterium]